MAVAVRIKQWVKERLTFQDLNTEFDNLITRVNERLDLEDVSETSSAGKVVRVNAQNKLPVSITGDAATVAGKTVGNASGNVPVSNGTLCVNLNAEKLNGKEVSATAAPDKILLVNAQNKLPASITGDAQTLQNKNPSVTKAANTVVIRDDSGIIRETLKSIDGVSNDGGNVDLIAGTGIAIAPDVNNKRITISATGGQAPGAHASEHEDAGTDMIDPTKLQKVSTTPAASVIPMYDASGRLKTNAPSMTNDCARKADVDAKPSLGETSATAYRGDRGKAAYDHSQSAHLQLGETSATAYRGDRGKIAYDHAQALHVPTTRNILAGNGLTGGGTLAADRTFTLGTPGDVSTASTNSVSSTSHTHLLKKATGSGSDYFTYDIHRYTFGSPQTRNSEHYGFMATNLSLSSTYYRRWIGYRTTTLETIKFDIQWDYLTASGNPCVWAVLDNSDNIVSLWEAEDPADPEFPDRCPLGTENEKGESIIPTGGTVVPLTYPDRTIFQKINDLLNQTSLPKWHPESIYKTLRTPAELQRVLSQRQYKARGLEEPPNILDVYGDVSEENRKYWYLQLWLRQINRILNSDEWNTLGPLYKQLFRVDRKTGRLILK